MAKPLSSTARRGRFSVMLVQHGTYKTKDREMLSGTRNQMGLVCVSISLLLSGEVRYPPYHSESRLRDRPV